MRRASAGVACFTVDASAIEDVTSLATRSEPVTFDLVCYQLPETVWPRGILTLRLRQLLQFIASLGSLLLGRLTGRRSMPICGLDIMAKGSLDPATTAVVAINA